MREQSEQPQQQQRYGLSLRILRITSIKTRKQIDSLSLQVKHIRIAQQSSELISSCSTQFVPKKHPIWMEDVYYNNNRHRDQLQLTLIGNREERFGAVVLDAGRFWRGGEGEGRGSEQVGVVFNDGVDCEVKVDIEVSVYENHDFLAGIRPPELSLAAFHKSPPRTSYNAIDTRPSRLNCFSYLDEEADWSDELQFFPRKFKTFNSRRS